MKRTSGYCPHCFEFREFNKKYIIYMYGQKSYLCPCGYWFPVEVAKDRLLDRLNVFHKIKKWIKGNDKYSRSTH